MRHGARDQTRTELARIAIAPLTRGREREWACSSMVEPAAHNGLVGGSNPSGPTTVLLILLIYNLFLKQLAHLGQRCLVPSLVEI